MAGDDGTRQMSESFLLGGLLAAVGGFLDAYTYLLRGGVFANAQTGNMILLGLNLAQGKPLKALYYILPILAFVLGVIAAEWIRSRFGNRPSLHWRQVILAVETLVLLATMFFPRNGSWDTAANIAVSFICSLQVESFRRVRGNSFATTMCTGNLRSGTELLCRYRQTRDSRSLWDGLRYFGIILFFILGAVLGTWLSGCFGVLSVLFCCVLLAVGFGLMFLRRETPGKGERAEEESALPGFSAGASPENPAEVKQWEK